MHLQPNPYIRPYCLTPANPLPENAKSLDTGDAGKDGYTVLSRASRESALRPNVGGEGDYYAPLPSPFPFNIQGTY
jgi:hypothetical protein